MNILNQTHTNMHMHVRIDAETEELKGRRLGTLGGAKRSGT